jgi:hypothetical protein
MQTAGLPADNCPFVAISANETHAKSSKPASKPVSKLAVSSRALRPSKAQQSESEGEEERQGSRGIKGTKESAVEVGDVDAGPGKAGKGDDLQRKLATVRCLPTLMSRSGIEKLPNR